MFLLFFLKAFYFDFGENKRGRFLKVHVITTNSKSFVHLLGIIECIMQKNRLLDLLWSLGFGIISYVGSMMMNTSAFLIEDLETCSQCCY